MTYRERGDALCQRPGWLDVRIDWTALAEPTRIVDDIESAAFRGWCVYLSSRGGLREQVGWSTRMSFCGSFFRCNCGGAERGWEREMNEERDSRACPPTISQPVAGGVNLVRSNAYERPLCKPTRSRRRQTEAARQPERFATW